MNNIIPQQYICTKYYLLRGWFVMVCQVDTNVTYTTFSVTLANNATRLPFKPPHALLNWYNIA